MDHASAVDTTLMNQRAAHAAHETVLLHALDDFENIAEACIMLLP